MNRLTIDYIIELVDNKLINVTELARLTGIYQATLYRNFKKPDSLSHENFLKIEKAIIDNNLLKNADAELLDNINTKFQQINDTQSLVQETQTPYKTTQNCEDIIRAQIHQINSLIEEVKKLTEAYIYLNKKLMDSPLCVAR